MNRVIQKTQFRLFLGLPQILLAMLVAVPTVSMGQQNTSESPRNTLRSIAPSTRLQGAVDRFKKSDPTATFTWLRGHVASYSAHPKSSVPSYARPILERNNISSAPVAQPKFSTTDSPQAPKSKGRSAPPSSSRTSSGQDVDFDGPDDQASTPGEEIPILDSKTENPDEETVWYEQTGRNVVKEILTAFLKANDDVFGLGSTLLNNNLPNLKLINYGVGKHF